MSDRGQPAREASDFEPAFRLDLEQQRKRAMVLRQAFLAGDDAAVSRFRHHHPALWNGGDTPSRPVKLSDAQFVIAREIGLSSWPKLKAHILAMHGMRDRIAHGAAAPDAGMATLHIRCGSDIKSRLTEAGFIGDFLEYSDALCQGPIVDDPGWMDRRAAFLADAYGPGVGRTREQIAEGLAQAEAGLQAAASRYERVVLWFEHDGYDQINLARCLAQFSGRRRGGSRWLRWSIIPARCDSSGSVSYRPKRCGCCGTNASQSLSQQAQAGQTVWTLLRQPDPTALAVAVGAEIPQLPYLARALRRHCQELPWTANGLGLTQRLILEVLAEQPRTIGQVFRGLMLERDPLPFLTDLMLADFVRQMQRVSQPVFTAAFDDNDRRWFRERLTITPLGRAILAGEVDWLSLSPPQRWVGGVSIRAGQPCWRWDERRGTTVLQG